MSARGVDVDPVEASDEQEIFARAALHFALAPDLGRGKTPTLCLAFALPCEIQRRHGAPFCVERGGQRIAHQQGRKLAVRKFFEHAQAEIRIGG